MQLLLICPDASDPTSYYRGFGPIGELRKQHPVEVISVETINWPIVSQSDVALFQRPFKAEHVQAIELCKAYNVPVVVDYDDWLLGLTFDNPAFKTYGQDHIKENIAKIMRLADYIWASTPHLAKLIGKVTQTPIDVIYNAYNPRHFPYAKHAQNPKNWVVFRGSNSHAADLSSVQDELIECILESDAKFLFMNFMPWFIQTAEVMKTGRLAVQEGQQFHIYMKSLYEIRPKVLIHPLIDTQFNRAKSNCAWIEATHAGANVLAPDFPEWQRAGITTYQVGKKGDFKDKLMGLLKDDKGNAQRLADSWQEIKDVYLLEIQNRKRMDILWRLAGPVLGRPTQYD